MPRSSANLKSRFTHKTDGANNGVRDRPLFHRGGHDCYEVREVWPTRHKNSRHAGCCRRAAPPHAWSALELTVGTNDGQVREVRSGVISGRVAYLQAAEVKFAQVFQRCFDFLVAGFGAGTAQALRKHLGSSKPFQRGLTDLVRVFDLGQFSGFVDHGCSPSPEFVHDRPGKWM